VRTCGEEEVEAGDSIDFMPLLPVVLHDQVLGPRRDVAPLCLQSIVHVRRWHRHHLPSRVRLGSWRWLRTVTQDRRKWDVPNKLLREQSKVVVELLSR